MERLLFGETVSAAPRHTGKTPSGANLVGSRGSGLKRYLYYALVLVLISVTIQRERFGIPWELDGPAVAVLAILVFLVSPASVFKLKTYPLLLPIAGFVLSGYVSCFVNINDLTALTRSGTPLIGECLRESAILTYRAIMFYTVVMAARYLPELRRKPPIIMLGLLLAQIIMCLALFPFYPSPVSQLLIRGGQFGEGSRAFMGLFLEPNLFGIYAVTTVALWASAALYLTDRRALVFTLASILVGSLGVYMSYTRSAWLAMFLVFSLLAVGIWRSDLGAERRRSVILLLGTTIVVGYVLSIGINLISDRDATTALIQRSGQLLESRAGSGASRLSVWNFALRDWIRKPWFGWGLLSFESESVPSTNGWLYSSVVQTLHDTGLVGVTFMLWVCAGIALHTWRSFREADSPIDKGIALGYLAGQAALFFTSQFSSFFWGGPTWVLFGLAVSYHRSPGGPQPIGAKEPRPAPKVFEESADGSD